MKSIQTKLLVTSILIVLLAIISLSTAYYLITKKDKHRESRQRINIAFDILLDGFTERVNTYQSRVTEYVKTASVAGSAYACIENPNFIHSVPFVTTFKRTTDDLAHFARINAIDRVTLYGLDKRLLSVYYHDDAQELFGIAMVSATGKDTYLDVSDSDLISPILMQKTPIPDLPAPPQVVLQYAEDIPDALATTLFVEEQKLGFRIIAPLFFGSNKVGVLVADVFYSQSMVQRYATLSDTEVNLFTGQQFSLGTLAAQTEITPEAGRQNPSCDDLLNTRHIMDVFPIVIDNQAYYQGQCDLKTAQQTVGALTVSLSQNIEQQATREMLTNILIISGLVIGVASGLSLLSSRKSVRFIQDLIVAIDRLSKGDIPEPITEEYRGEFQAIKQNLNALIAAMHEVTRLAEEIATGNLSVEVNMRSDRDVLMRALQMMVASLRDVTRVAEGIAAGNLTVEVKERSPQDTLMHALHTMIAKLSDVVTQVKAAAGNVATGSREMRDSAEELSEGVSQQAVAMEEVSSSMEEMAANSKHTAENALQTEKIAQQSSEYTEESSHVVAETVLAMQQITKKITVIQDIADKTHLLSLNATIEAARAQDAGKAFSVVAAEVRKLAETSKTAANEINELATSSVGVAENAGQMLAQLVPNIYKTTGLVQEISVASREQSSGAEQVNRAIQQLDQIAQHNAMTSEQVATAAEELAAQAEQLQQATAFFTVNDLTSGELPVTESEIIQGLKTLFAAQKLDEQTLTTLITRAFPSVAQAGAEPLLSKHETSDRKGNEAQPPLTPEGDALDENFERF